MPSADAERGRLRINRTKPGRTATFEPKKSGHRTRPPSNSQSPLRGLSGKTGQAEALVRTGPGGQAKVLTGRQALEVKRGWKVVDQTRSKDGTVRIEMIAPPAVKKALAKRGWMKNAGARDHAIVSMTIKGDKVMVSYGASTRRPGNRLRDIQWFRGSTHFNRPRGEKLPGGGTALRNHLVDNYLLRDVMITYGLE